MRREALVWPTSSYVAVPSTAQDSAVPVRTRSGAQSAVAGTVRLVGKMSAILPIRK